MTPKNGRKNLYYWGEMIWLADGQDDSCLDLSMARMIVHPGQTSEPHCHDNCYECIHVVSGNLREHVGSNVFELEEGKTVIIPPNTRHFSENFGDENAVLIIAYSQSLRNYTPLT